MQVIVQNPSNLDLNIYGKSLLAFVPELNGGFSLIGEFSAVVDKSSTNPVVIFKQLNAKYYVLFIKDLNASPPQASALLLEYDAKTMTSYPIALGANTLLVETRELKLLTVCQQSVFSGIPTNFGELPVDFKSRLLNPQYAVGAMASASGVIPLVHDFEAPTKLQGVALTSYVKSSVRMSQTPLATPTTVSAKSAWTPKPVPQPVDGKIHEATNENVPRESYLDRSALPKLPKGIQWSFSISGILFVSTTRKSDARHPMLFVDCLGGYLEKKEMQTKEMADLIRDQAGRLNGIAMSMRVIADACQSVAPAEEVTEFVNY